MDVWDLFYDENMQMQDEELYLVKMKVKAQEDTIEVKNRFRGLFITNVLDKA